MYENNLKSRNSVKSFIVQGKKTYVKKVPIVK